MQLIRARRLMAGLAVAFAVIAAAPVPASAAPRAAGVSMYVTDVTVPVGADDGVMVPTFFSATTQVELLQPTITYELAGGLSGVTLLAGEDVFGCENEAPTKLVCTSPFSFDVGPDGIGSYFDVYLKAADDSAVGASGTVRATFSARGLAPITGEARVRVAESVDLTAGAEQRFTVAVGESFEAPLVVSNTGDKVITGASVLFDDDYALESTKSYRNCLYSGDVLLSCTFDQPLAVGKSYAAALGMKVRADTMAPGGADAFRSWQTNAELEDYHAFLKQLGVSPGLRAPAIRLPSPSRPARGRWRRATRTRRTTGVCWTSG